MEILRLAARKTGKALALTGLALFLAQTAAWGAEVRFSAIPDRTEIGQDESLSLRISVQTDGRARVSDLSFHSADFEVINEFQSSSTQMHSSINDQGMLDTQTVENTEVTKILRPLKQGLLKISGIQVLVDGKKYQAPEITIRVSASGAGSPPPRNYGGGGVGLRGAGKKVSGQPIFVRSEVSKDRVYKGEQLVASYYLYQRVRTTNVDLMNFPIFTGFLKEDLEMPVMGRRMDGERVVLDGVAYERSLLARYALYPLQEGKLVVDSVQVKYSYYAGQSGGLDVDDDPFANFFRALSPRAGTSRSEPIRIEVLPLPADGRPISFSGGVGDFNVMSAVDKYDVRANEALTVTVKVEGHGNLAAVAAPKAKWPDTVELYDTKGQARTSKGGVGEKVFEFLLIPRVPGKLDLPGLDFSFFDPVKKQYVTKTTEPISVTVREPAPGSQVYVPPTKSGETTASPAAPNAPQAAPADWSGLKPPGAPSGGLMLIGQQGWHVLYWIFGALLTIFGLVVGYDLIRRTHANSRSAAENRSRAYAKSWERLRLAAKQANNGASWSEVSQDYERLTGLIFDAIDQKFKVGARSLPRAELRERLVVERGLPEDAWSTIVLLLEFAELVRFASSAGAISEEKARTDLGRWVKVGEEVVRAIEKSPTQ